MAKYLWIKLDTILINPIVVYQCKASENGRVKGVVWSYRGTSTADEIWQAGIGEVSFDGFHMWSEAKHLVVMELERRLDIAYEKRHDGKMRPSSLRRKPSGT